jgi:2-(3-amino-3-carboxypropyl)histidine synthase
MRTIRNQAVQDARKSIETLTRDSSVVENENDASGEVETPLWGVVLGTLGRQGSFKQLQVFIQQTSRIRWTESLIPSFPCDTQAVTNQLSTSRTPIPYVPILLSELSPAKLALFNPHISTFIQTSCPRLSIDWGYAFDRPLLSPYETAVAVRKAVGWMDEEKTGKDGLESGIYPMDFYEAGSPWAVSRAKAAF